MTLSIDGMSVTSRLEWTDSDEVEGTVAEPLRASFHPVESREATDYPSGASTAPVTVEAPVAEADILASQTPMAGMSQQEGHTVGKGVLPSRNPRKLILYALGVASLPTISLLRTIRQWAKRL